MKRRKTQAVGKKLEKSSHKKDTQNSEDDMIGDSSGEKGILSDKDGSKKENCGATC